MVGSKLPGGADVVSSIPRDHEIVVLSGKQYLRHGRVVCEPFFLDGRLNYRVVSA